MLMNKKMHNYVRIKKRSIVLRTPNNTLQNNNAAHNINQYFAIFRM